MSQPNTTADSVAERRAELLRQAERQGVRALSFEELLGDPEAGDPAKEDVDDFLAMRREWREDERARGRR
jgi:hypothetical protein